MAAHSRTIPSLPFAASAGTGVTATSAGVETTSAGRRSPSRWSTVRRDGPGWVETAAFIAASCIAAVALALGVAAVRIPALGRGAPSGVVLVFAALAALAATGDLRVLRRGGVRGRARILRHLWRMCLALFIAVGSFFLGQPQVFPASIRGTPLLFLPEVAVLASMIFWLLRARPAPGR